MGLEAVRRTCLSFPHATENVQWGDNLVFKVTRKIFAIAALEPGEHCLSFKYSPEVYAELLERPGIVPAPYLARAHWVALKSFTALPASEIQARLRDSYDLVVAKLPKKAMRNLGGAGF